MESASLVPDFTKSDRDFWESLRLNENENYKKRKLSREEL